MDDDSKIKSLCIMLPKTSTYVKRYDGETTWCIFLLKMMNYLKNIIIFKIKSALLWNNNLIPNPSIIKNFENQNKIYVDEATDFHDGKMPKGGSNYICLAVILIGLVLKEDGHYYPQVFLKECKYIEKKVVRYITDDPEISSDDSDKEA